MSNTEWIDDIDVIIRSNIVAISKIFEEMKSKVSDTPFNSESMLEQLNASERLYVYTIVPYITNKLYYLFAHLQNQRSLYRFHHTNAQVDSSRVQHFTP